LSIWVIDRERERGEEIEREEIERERERVRLNLLRGLWLSLRSFLSETILKDKIC
jgi:hypothetical protein